MPYVLLQTILIVAWLAAILWNPAPRLLPGPLLLDVAGTILCVAALAVAAAAFHDLGSSFQISPYPRASSTLVTRGVYGILRHPMYTSVAAVSIGVFLVRSSWVVGLLGFALVLFYHVKAHHEERLLLHRYPEYAAYRRRTLGIVPWVSR
jgi:protein-S-isoprenylcysteine O-methyltransferase Ste14